METKAIKNKSRVNVIDTNAADAAEIRRLNEEWAKALREKNIEGLMVHYAPEIVVFGITPPLHYTGKENHRKHWEDMLASFEDVVDYKIHDLHITADHNIAFSESLNYIGGEMKNGQNGGTWIRVTVCYKRVNNKWLATHEHVSVPFDPTTGYASVDLEPINVKSKE